MANRHHLNADFDLAILKRLFGRMKSGMITDDEVAINLSVHSLEDEKLCEWLFAAMQADRNLAQRVVFELTEFGLVHDRAKVNYFVHEIRKLGAKFAVDNFGLHHSAFEYLQEMKPRYIKLSLGYIRDLANNPKHQFFISSVVKITRPLEVRVIAVGVEDAGMLELLHDLGVDGYQGYITGKMVELD
jgi:EAL domain-containing protein (putative c-di-GMP-specific phosphodiesterase class I)